MWRDDPHTDAEGLTEEEAELILRWIEQKDPNYFAGLPTPEEAWQHLEQIRRRPGSTWSRGWGISILQERDGIERFYEEGGMVWGFSWRSWRRFS